VKSEKQRDRMLNSLKQYQLGKAKNIVANTFQEMIRWEYAAKCNGVLHCCTCNAKGTIGENKFDSGHFIQGRRSSVIFNEMNCHPQCKDDNRRLYGKPEAYRRFMLETYGEDAVEELESLGRQTHKFTHDELCDLKIEFLERIRRAKARLK